jgi:hypothetical protein
MGLFKTKCKYALKCEAYRDNSYTCTKELDKRYCGIYRLFVQNTIQVYTTNASASSRALNECTSNWSIEKKD